VRFFPHLHIPLWIRGRVLPTLEERREDRADLKDVIEKGLREEQRQQAADEGKAGTRKPG
jgi:hypothetical protein